MKKLISLFFVLILFACDGKAQKTVINDKKCNGYYLKRYKEFFNQWSSGQKNDNIIDSTLYYINKQISCDPKNMDYIHEKANFLIYNGLYEKAMREIDSISDTEPVFKMMKGTLALKLGKNNAEELLKDARKEFIQYIKKYNDPTDISWKIILDNYFEGEEYALREAEKAKINFKDEYEISVFESIEEMIKENTKKEILYKVFYIQ